MEIANGELPEWFLFDSKDPDRYLIYPQKLLDKTWAALQDSKLVGEERHSFYDDYIMNSSFGLTIMAILADISAGTQKRTMTDREEAYSGLTRFMTKELGGNYQFNQELSSAHERLVTVSLKLLDINEIPLEKLKKFRIKEQKENTSDYEKLRHNYVDKIDKYARKLVTECKHQGDYNQIIKDFESVMVQDYQDLAEAMEWKLRKFVFSPSTYGVMVAAAGAFFEPTVSSIVGIGSLYSAIGSITKYQEERKEALSRNSMSWLYKLDNT